MPRPNPRPTPAPERPLAHVEPMLATPTDHIPHGDDWAFEFKWDGYRAILHIEDGHVRIESRRLNDITRQFPTIAALAAELDVRDAILDGEIVALDASNRPSFGLLQQHLRVRGSGPAPAGPVPLVFFAFDLLALGRRPLLARSYDERRAALLALDLDDGACRVPPAEIDHGEAMVAASESLRLEGVIAKRRESRYTPGYRSPDWLKIKHRRRQDFVVGGYTRGEGARASTFGSLLLGYYDRDAHARTAGSPVLVYAGRVGTGFDDATLRRLRRDLDRLAAPKNPFGKGDPGADARFVRPELVAEVSYSEWTHLDQLRQTAFHGLRDKDPLEVLRDPIIRTKDV